MNEKKILLILLFSVIVLLVSSTLILSSSSEEALDIRATANAEAKVNSTTYDFGSKSMQNGDIVKIFTISNLGSEPLKLFNVRTSCHCTVATVKIDGKESQAFGMSGVSSWIGEVPPGKVAELKVIFDPAFHGPQGVGPIYRYISVETNDAGNEKVTFTLSGTVTK